MIADTNRGFAPATPVGSLGTVFVDPYKGFPCPQQTKIHYYVKIQLDKSSEVDKNSVVDIISIKRVDESSVLVENTGLKLEELDENAVVYQSVVSRTTT